MKWTEWYVYVKYAGDRSKRGERVIWETYTTEKSALRRFSKVGPNTTSKRRSGPQYFLYKVTHELVK